MKKYDLMLLISSNKISHINYKILMYFNFEQFVLFRKLSDEIGNEREFTFI